MSSFVCSPEHFNSLEAYLLVNFKNYYVMDLENEVDINRFFKKLRRLNVISVNEQYGDNEDPDHLDVLTKIKQLNELGFLKALQCVRYQIEYVPNEYIKTHEKLKKLIAVVSERIVSNLVAYDREEWEIIIYEPKEENT